MKKQLIALVLMLSVAASTFAVEAEIGGLWYEILTKGNVAKVIEWKNNIKYSGNIVIPETIEYEGVKCSVSSIEKQAFVSCSGLTSVTIPNSVTSIGNLSFYGCSSLISVSIPNSVTSIGDEAFYNCKALTSVTISGSVTSIGYKTFYDCSSLTSVTIQDGVTNIGNSMFHSCRNLTSVTIPGSVTSIGEYAFEFCTGLTSVTIQNGVKSIGKAAFDGCSSLTTITIPNSVTSIGSYTFYGCSSLASVTIPNSVTSLDDDVFYGCSSLTSVTIPNSVKSIGSSAFCECSRLIRVNIGSSVQTIENNAFAYCPELADVYCYATSVPSTSKYAFTGSYTEYATLHVPTASISAYKLKNPWIGFKAIVGIDDTTPETPKCATPTIAFINGELVFSCETEGVEYTYEITNKDPKNGNGSKVKISGTYTVSVYATKTGYENSDKATMEFTPGAGGKVCDVNGDGTVDVADIATIISEMAASSRQESRDDK